MMLLGSTRGNFCEVIKANDLRYKNKLTCGIDNYALAHFLLKILSNFEV